MCVNGQSGRKRREGPRVHEMWNGWKGSKRGREKSIKMLYVISSFRTNEYCPLVTTNVATTNTDCVYVRTLTEKCKEAEMPVRKHIVVYIVAFSYVLSCSIINNPSSVEYILLKNLIIAELVKNFLALY
jgi:hypothetical protein